MTVPADELSIAEQVDASCDRFEAEFQAGRRPRLEDFLGDATEPLRTQLFRGLVELELELRWRAGELPQREHYVHQFPQHASVIDLVFAELSAGPSRRFSVRAAAQDSSVKTSAFDTSQGPMQSDGGTAPPPLTQIARFQIEKPLGEGAFGTVYKARDPQLDRNVAIKVPRTGALSTKEERDRFLREARASAGLHHPNICPVYEVGSAPDGRDYIVMAFIEGKSLSQILHSGTAISSRQVATVIRKLALGLAEAHAKGVVHRDLKPANIMINRKGEPVIMDFGLARRDNAGDVQISHSGQIMGTPAYMSPEQARGDSKRVGPAADIYSLGVVMYELLCGARPFSGTITEVIGKILHVEAPPPSAHRPKIDPQLEAICVKAIAKHPEDRFASMKDLAAVLMDYLKHAAAPPAAASMTAAVPPEPGEPLHTKQLARLVTAVSSDIEEKVQRAVRSTPRPQMPWWPIALSSGIIGMIVLFGVIFFARTPTTTVMINIDVDTKDPALTFFLDGASIEGEALGRPIELLEGRHELLVKRNGKTFRKYELKVKRGEQQAAIALKENAAEPEPPSVASPAAQSEREIAVQNLSNGGAVRVAKPDRIPVSLSEYYALPYLTRVDQLPPEPWHVVGIDLKGGLATDAHLKQLSALKHLKLLWLFGDDFTDEGMRHLSHHKELLELLIECRQMTDAGLKHVGTLGSLEACTIRFARVTDDGLRRLAALSHINHLQVSQSLITGSGLDALVNLKRLNWLNLWDNPNLTDSNLRHVTSLQGLTDLYLDATPVGDAAAQPIRELPRLKLLSLSQTKITGAALDELAQIPDLGVLYVNDTALGDADASKFKKFPALVNLSVSGTRLGNDGIQALSSVSGLQSLTVGATRFDDEGLKHIAKMVGLQSLSLIDVTRISDAGVAHLANLKKMISLILDGTNLTDACVEDLGKLTSLHGLHLNRTSISPAGLRRLQQLLPKAQISPAPPKSNDESPPPPSAPRRVEVSELNATGYNTAPWPSSDGLTIYWEGRRPESATDPDPFWVHAARRPNPQSPFADDKALFPGRHPTLPADQLEMVFVRGQPRMSRLRFATRNAVGEEWTLHGEIPEFASLTNAKSPALSEDGLTLVFEHGVQDAIQFAMSKRSDRKASWSAPRALPIGPDPTLTEPMTWPFASRDGLTLWYCQGGAMSPEIRVATRPTRGGTALGNHQPVIVDGKPLIGRSPRYVEATRELFFASNQTQQQQFWALWVVKDYRPPTAPSLDHATQRPLGDHARYAAGPWTKMWDSEAAVKDAVVRGTYGDDVTLLNGVLTVRNKCALRGPGPVRNLVVRLRIKHDEGKGCFINLRSDPADNGNRYTNWINGYKQFGLGRHDEGKFVELGGHASLPNLKNGQFYEWLGVADGNLFAIFINGELLLRMEDAAIDSGHFALVVSDGAATVRDAEYRLLDAPLVKD